MKKHLGIFGRIILALSLLVACSNNDGHIKKESCVMTNDAVNVVKEIVEHPNKLPISFVYGNVVYYGISPEHFRKIEDSITTERNKETFILKFLKDDVLSLTLIINLFKDYNAYDYTVYFENISNSKETQIIEKIQAIDTSFKSNHAILSGLKGDYGYQFAPYCKDLTKESVSFNATRGRSTHDEFPYFDLELDDGGSRIALGWSGTWNSSFEYDDNEKAVLFKGTGTTDLCTYLKPGEKIRTCSVTFLNYKTHDKGVTNNHWRRFIIDCIYPRENANSDKCPQPMTCSYFAFDNDTEYKHQTDGSGAENFTTWYNSFITCKDNGIKSDIHWFDAGWYSSPLGGTCGADWWGNVGTWELDPIKWPEDTFKEYMDTMHDEGEKIFVWFEVERVTHLAELVGKYGYKYEWALSVNGRDVSAINNIGNPDAWQWTLDKILTFMDTYKIDVYREDFNTDPAPMWAVGDALEGKNRIGITENKYIQGHYALWDAILEHNKKMGRCTYLDGCASGGGRIDIESLHRAVTFVRSDSDAASLAGKLSITQRLTNWVPFTTSGAKYNNSYETSGPDLYELRTNYLCLYNPQARWYMDRNRLDYKMFRDSKETFDKIKTYLLEDFYSLADDFTPGDNTKWAAYMYYKPNEDCGVIQAFRQEGCQQPSVVINVQGVNPDKYYKIVDADGNKNINRIKGSELRAGFELTAEKPMTSFILYIESID